MLGLSLSLCSARTAGSSWTPLDIEDVSVFVDPDVALVVDGSNRITEAYDQAGDETLVNYYDGSSGMPIEDWWPTLEANAFGSHNGIRHTPAPGAVPAITSQYLHLSGGNRVYASGISIFWVSKHTSVRAAANHGTQNLPLVVAGDPSSSAAWINAGFKAGELGFTYFESAAYQHVYRGSGYNDGTPRVYGWTHNSTTGALKAWVNGEQVGTTITATYAALTGFASIGCGYRAERPVDPFGGDDGFDGTTGLFLVIGRDISATPDDIAALQSYAETRGWVP